MSILTLNERKSRIINNVCHPVSKRFDDLTGKYHIINDNTGSVLSEVSKRYALVKNEDVLKPFVDRFGIDNLKSVVSYGAGKYTLAKFETGRVFNLSGIAGDEIKEQLVVRNSYNKTASFSFLLGAFRLVCSNGLYTGQALIKYKKIHVGEIPVQEIVSEALNNYGENNFDLWRNFAQKPLTVEEELTLIRSFQAYEPEEGQADYKGNALLNRQVQYTASRLVSAAESVDNQRNVWGLYNQINRAIANNVRGEASISKRILGNNRAESYLAKELQIA